MIEAGDRRAHVAFVDVVAEMINWPPYMVSWQGVLRGAFLITKTQGEFEFHVDPRTRRVDAIWTW